MLVIGSGGAGLTFALAVKRWKPRLQVLIIERTDSVGGCTAYSGGGIWLPGHGWMENQAEDLERTRKYLQHMYPSIDRACLEGFLAEAPRLWEFFQATRVRLERSLGYPDYYQEIDGASSGRTLFPRVYKGPRSIRALIRNPPPYYLPFTLNELIRWGTHRIGHWDKKLLAKRMVFGHLTMGRAFVAFLLEACMQAGIDIVLNANADELVIENGRFAGAVINDRRISSCVGMMACGGFSHHPELMSRVAAVRPVLSVAPEASESGGGGLRLALGAGLEVGNPTCWWVPVMKLCDEREEKPGPDLWAYHPTLQDRCWPGGIMVNAEGRRFTNESACYNTVGGILAQGEDASLNRVWLVWGDLYVRNYIRGTSSYVQPAKSYMNKSRSVDELADKIGVPAGNLRETIDHWNDMAARGRDEDFHRGESAYDRYMGDAFRSGHPNIGPVEAPFQAVRLYPGALGTKMGAATDEHGRVRLKDGRTVSGLYAAGNAAASLFGNFYPGAGATLGQACVFAYRSAQHVCGRS